MARIERGDILAVVEAAYRVDEPERDWLREIARAAHPLLDQGSGVIAFTVDLSTELELTSSAASRPAPALSEYLHSVGTIPIPIEDARKMYEGKQGCTASQRLGRSLARVELFKLLRRLGFRDMFVTAALDPSMIGAGIVPALPTIQSASRAAQAAWTRVGVHFVAALRLRRRLEARAERPSEELMRTSEAVLTPGGRVDHAAGIAREKPNREALREAARAIDRARGSMRKRDPDAALDLWQGLVNGRWSLVDHFDTDGRRFVVARENEPGGPTLAPLSPRERAVLSLRARGRPMKLIAYELGLGVSAVGALLWRARRKLGIGADADLSLLFAMRREASMS